MSESVLPSLDEADGADGDEVVGVVGLGVVLLDYVRDEAEIVLNEHVARLDISREPEVYVFALLLRRERPRERAGRRSKPQHQKCAREQHHKSSSKQNKHHLINDATFYSPTASTLSTFVAAKHGLNGGKGRGQDMKKRLPGQ